MALSQREKMLLAVPVVIGALLAHYNWIHEPLFTRKALALEEKASVEAELAREQSRLSREGNLTQRRNSLIAREQVIDAWVPGKNSATLLIWYLSQAEKGSGARIQSITVSEKREVTPKPSGEQEPGAEQPAPTLTMVRLELKVGARFIEHLLFNQSLEETPLFLNTSGLSLVREGGLPLEAVSRSLSEGRHLQAAQLLGASPPVAGVYLIDLYFKGGKAGPATDPMSFAHPAGRVDPFAMSDVDEFIRTLLQYYGRGGGGGQGGSETTQPAGPPGVQLG